MSLQPLLNSSLSLGLDNLSYSFVLLVNLLIPFCLISAWELKKQSQVGALFFLLQLILNLLFTSTDFLFFYFFFEIIVLLIVILIIKWGRNIRKQKAVVYFFIYSIFGSFFLLLALIYFLINVGSLSYLTFYRFGLNPEQQIVIVFCLFIGFAVKIPVWPFSLWLPEAHVEAPTAGSIVLAGLLLKIGGYGIARFIFFFPYGVTYLSPFIYTLAILSMAYNSIAALVQTDLKRVIAYSSIVHINFAVIGLFSITDLGIIGALIIMFSHGIVSTALFFLVGVLYKRHGTRSLNDYGGLSSTIPLFSIFFFLFNLSNIGFPLSGNFVSEVLLFFGIIYQFSLVLFLVVIFSSLITLVFTLILLQKILFGTFTAIRQFRHYDLSRLEFYILLLLFLLNLWIGIYPSFLIRLFYPHVCFIKEILYPEFLEQTSFI
jgi:NADH-quinone oxidoreductase subunit M